MNPPSKKPKRSKIIIIDFKIKCISKDGNSVTVEIDPKIFKELKRKGLIK